LMSKPQFIAARVPGWPPIVTGSVESGVCGHSLPWIEALVLMPSATQAASRLVVGAADTNALVASPAGPNASTTGSWKIGAGVPCHVALAGVATQPIGSVIEYG